MKISLILIAKLYIFIYNYGKKNCFFPKGNRDSAGSIPDFQYTFRSFYTAGYILHFEMTALPVWQSPLCGNDFLEDSSRQML